MQKSLKFLSFVFAILLFINQLYPENQTTIAILNLKSEGISQSEANIITDRLRTELFLTKSFKVLEREKMQDILTEQGFQISGCTSNECVVEAGKLIGVKQMVAGYIGKIGTLITINIRLIDVETGQIIKTATEDCNCSIETVLTQSLKRIANKLSSKKITYSKDIVDRRFERNQNKKYYNIKSIPQKPDTSGLNSFLQAGFSYNDFANYKKYNFTLDRWQKYEDSKLSVLPSIFKSLLVPGWGQLSLGKNSGYIYLTYEVALITLTIYQKSHIKKLEGQGKKYEDAKTEFDILIGLWMLNHLVSGVLAKNNVDEINDNNIVNYSNLYF